MSTPGPPNFEDRALARRYNFLGFPSERRGGTLSYSELQAELGPANAASLVTQIGVLIQAHHADQQGLGLNHIVDRVVQAMTSDERRTMSQSNMIPPRVQALISAEVEAAKQQTAQLGKGPAGTNAPAGQNLAQGWAQGAPYGFGTGRFAGVDGRGTSNGSVSGATPPANTPVPGSAAYNNIVGNFGVDSRGVLNGFTHQMYSNQFRSLGYSEPVAKNVAGILGRNEGLSGAALVARTKEVARDTKEGLGLAVNKYAPAVANVGKQNSNKTIEHKHLLDEAEKLQNEGKTDEAAKVIEQYNQRRDQHLQEMQQTPQKNPNVIPDQKNLYQGIEEDHRAIHNNPAFRPMSSQDEKYGAVGPKVVGKAPASDTEQRADLEGLGFLGEKSGPTKAADATPVKGLEKGEATKPEDASTMVSSLESKPGSSPKSSEKGAKPDGTDTKVATQEPRSGPSAKGKASATSPKMA